MTLTSLKETIKRFLPFITFASVVGLSGLLLFVFFYKPKPKPEVLAHSEEQAYTFAWSGDGRKLYYLSSGEKTSSFRVLEVKSGKILKDEASKVETGALINVFWSSNSKALVWEQATAGKAPQSSIVDFEGGDSTPVPLLKDSSRVASWSPNGARIAYVTKANKKGEANINLLLVSALTLSRKNLLKYPFKSIYHISWSAGGDKLFVFAGQPAAGIPAKLYQLEIGSGKLSSIFTGKEGYLSFVPFDGQALLLTSNGAKVVSLEDKKARTVFSYSINRYNTRCAWLDENQAICQVVSSTSDKRTLWKINLQTLRREAITTVPVTPPEQPSLYFASSPQKDQLAYVDAEGFIRIAPVE